MLPLQDGSLRLIVLTHLVARLQQGRVDELLEAGIDPDQIDRLRTLNASDIKRLAEMPQPTIRLALDSGSVNSGLRCLAVVKDTRFLEDYFIRHGASPKMMRTLFTMRFDTTRARRRAFGLNGLTGRPVLPAIDSRDRIHRFWAAHPQLDLRSRYYQLHQAFPAYRLDTLDSVVAEFERNKR